MNKHFKRLAAVVCGATASLGVLALAACGDSTVLYDGYGSDYIVPHDDGKTVTYTFEAEYTNLTNKSGPAASGSYVETEMVQRTSEASNGYAVSGMYAQGVSLNFVIVSDREITDAELILTLGAECNFSFSLGANDFLVRVDPVIEEDVHPYEEDGAWGKWDQFFLDYYSGDTFEGYYLEEFSCGKLDIAATSSDPSGFKDYTVTTTLHLYAGLNSISLITNNSTIPEGPDNATMTASAPIVDCIKIKTNANLGLYNPQQNLSGLNLNNACTID